MVFRFTLLTTALATLAAAPDSRADDWPPPVRALIAEGLEIHGDFPAPGGLTGYAASHQGREMTVFVTADGEHAIVGTLVDAEGNDLSEAPLDELVRAPQENELWRRLEESHWIADGSVDAPRTLYTFTDPNCPYCHRFWEAARPWVEAGEVQLRHIMVGILEPDSPAKAAALLGADEPSAALHRHSSGNDVAPSAQPRNIEDQVYRNNQLFEELGFYATPSTLFLLDGRLERVDGMPDEARLVEMMGGEAP
ncbi:thiol:disulfide interchange protein DsbG [Halomonas sp. MCCC 1A17488]|uniref:Thiol:disulfide interchange protein n=1 Tax=Billgrantia sulfidoxydans TaxID=2733484 RepID=A0ABX7W7R7_9GAMM|nr:MULTISPECIES: thiol:disulfide interchange protein DsbG [Halomonas]MCE8018122.1 thiol:disulfide interchange protein DsbG [Halomonas sp. MCCC 1A17488]MCG3241455.1 thiol:disulfide interchange protein DsbG [Halomonas sp. MCCC 1A17488]QPP48586.1 thiol:disulfide interchange protein DsbG [Halomonas sp. SS10-MC5]QTP55931.1 thiol:disulfide interchange protein DsbG [Halomonas sulfidoxydans]